MFVVRLFRYGLDGGMGNDFAEHVRDATTCPSTASLDFVGRRFRPNPSYQKLYQQEESSCAAIDLSQPMRRNGEKVEAGKKIQNKENLTSSSTLASTPRRQISSTRPLVFVLCGQLLLWPYSSSPPLLGDENRWQEAEEEAEEEADTSLRRSKAMSLVSALPGIIRTLKMMGTHGLTFAAIGGVYVGVEQMVQHYRAKRDFFSGAIGGFVVDDSVLGYSGNGLFFFTSVWYAKMKRSRKVMGTRTVVGQVVKEGYGTAI
ncbi:unnamed protein product [Cochlearia groenlandica]